MMTEAKVYQRRIAAAGIIGLAMLSFAPGAFGRLVEAGQGTATFASMPLYFEANRGQAGSDYKFFSRGHNCNFFIAPTEAVMVLSEVNSRASDLFDELPAGRQILATAVSVNVHFEGANPTAQMEGTGQLPGRVNYLIGSNPAQWQSNLPIFSRTRVGEIYPGIDLVYYGNQQRLEFDFEVSRGADPKDITMRIEGASKIYVDSNGDLILNVGKREIRQQRPVAYQNINGIRKEISCVYQIVNGNQVIFKIGEYDRSQPLIIDPILNYSSYFGGSGSDIGRSIALDASGNIYVAGETMSLQLPTTPGAFQTNSGGGNGVSDAFVAKFGNTLSNLVYLTYLGGSDGDGALGLAIDGGLNVYLTGYTTSTNFPVVSAISTNIAGPNISGFVFVDGFVAKLNPSGSGLIYSTYLGGDRSDEGFAIAVDSANQAYVTGFTESTNFPLKNAYQMNYAGGRDAFVAKLTAAGNDFVYSTYFGGTNSDSGVDIVADSAGDAQFVGYTGSTNFPLKNAIQPNFNSSTNFIARLDAFVAKLTPSGNDLVYSTYIGGGNDDAGLRIALDGAENTFVTGWTTSTNFPVTTAGIPMGVNSNNVSRDVFVTGLGPYGTNWIYSTIFGGSGSDEGRGLAIDMSGNVLVAGATTSTNFPTADTSGFLRSTNSGTNDVFIAQIAPGGSNLLYSVYLGGSRADLAHSLAVDAAGDAYVVGETASTNFPVVGAFDSTSSGTVDAFVAKIGLPPMLALQISGDKVHVSWPAFAPEYQLESKLNMGGEWMPVAASPVLTNNLHVVTLPVTNAMSSFRLRKK